ncbi:MAG TPA: hypothetical protein VFW62_02810, partial [bacterium]|nr:hypothetical protein [bacterium]
ADELSHSILEDTGVPPSPDFRPPYSPSYHFTDVEVAELKSFAAENPLKRSIQPLLLPDVAVPTGGPGFYDGDLVLQRFLTQAEFKARYGSHAGYVAAFTAATLQRILERLWDPKLAAREIVEAIAHPIPLATEVEAQTLASPGFQAPALRRGDEAAEKAPRRPRGASENGCMNSWHCR